MVTERLRDGRRIAQLLASELTGDRERLAGVVVVDADPEVEPTDDGALAYRVIHVSDPGAVTVGSRGETTVDDSVEADQTALAEVFVQPDRARVEFSAAPEAAAAAAREADLRVRPKAVEPPRTLVFVKNGAQAKWILPVFAAIIAAVDDSGE